MTIFEYESFKWKPLKLKPFLWGVEELQEYKNQIVKKGFLKKHLSPDIKKKVIIYPTL